MRCGAEAEGGGTSDMAMAAVLSYSGGSACVDDERTDQCRPLLNAVERVSCFKRVNISNGTDLDIAHA